MSSLSSGKLVVRKMDFFILLYQDKDFLVTYEAQVLISRFLFRAFCKDF